MEQLKAFLDSAHSSYHAIALTRSRLQEEGFVALEEGQNWNLQAGGRYYLTRGGNALVAFCVPEGKPAGFMLSAAHCDRPTFKVKENGELVGKYTRLSTEKYGGMLIAPWLDRPLSVAGRVMVKTEKGIESKLVDIDRDLLLIPNVAIHQNRKANEGYSWNPAVDTLPLIGGENAKGKLDQLLQEMAGGKILGHDLYLYVRQNASIWGVDEEYISAAALDDLACVWCCTEGLLEAKADKAIPVLCVFDSEEVGSCSAQGAGSTLLMDVLTGICSALQLDRGAMLCQSMMVSADNGHALHPNHPEYSDANNAPILGGGVVLKFNANLRYTTDGFTAAVMRSVAQRVGAELQSYYNRADLPGGSTLGCISLGQVSVPSVDIGLPQLAMHSCYETAAVEDVKQLKKLMTAYYESALRISGDGDCEVLAK